MSVIRRAKRGGVSSVETSSSSNRCQDERISRNATLSRRRGTDVALSWNMTSRDSIATRSTVGAVVLLALFVGGCGSAGSSTSPGCTPTPTNPECVNPPNLLTVTITNGVFSPNPVMVTVGQSVNWHNTDAVAHTATDPGVFDTGSIPPFSAHDNAVLFSTIGTYNYHCTLHANETATVIVTQ